jgi:hypothetical protein
MASDEEQKNIWETDLGKVTAPTGGKEAEILNKSQTNISVIIPAYNRANLIGETLKSLLNQTVPAKEIIVVDDGSQDGTAEAVLEMLKLGEAEKLKISERKPWPEIKVIRQANAGPGAARNRGMAEATGEFIHFFDSDDIAAPNKHEVQLRALLETGADIAYGPWVKGRFLPVEKLKYGKAETLKAELTTIEHWGRCEKEQPKVGPKGQGAGATESKDTGSTEDQFVQKQGGTWASQVCATESDSLTSKPADSPVSESPNRSAIGPASALRADEDGRSKLVDRSQQGSLESGRWTLDAASWFFTPEGPVLQARGLPAGSLIKALLTNWSVVPHACLFRWSILDRMGGFPEGIWVGEDQLLFLRCLLAGAKVVHTPGTMVFYRLGDEGKLTESREGQRRRVVDWGRFLLSAKKEIEDRRSEIGGASVGSRFPAEARRRGEAVAAKKLTTEDTECTEDQFIQKQDFAWAGRTGASESDSLASELDDAPVSEPLTRYASDPASALDSRLSSLDSKAPASSYSLSATALFCDASPDTRNSLLVTTTPAAWFGFRLRAYEAWRDLRAFFPGEYRDLESGLENIWKRSKVSVFGFQLSGFLVRKIGGAMQRVTGSRVKRSFRVGRYTKQEAFF